MHLHYSWQLNPRSKLADVKKAVANCEDQARDSDVDIVNISNDHGRLNASKACLVTDLLHTYRCQEGSG